MRHRLRKDLRTGIYFWLFSGSQQVQVIGERLYQFGNNLPKLVEQAVFPNASFLTTTKKSQGI